MAATYLIAGLGGNLSPDDAMRLVQVRDLLAGQSWFDLTQYRLDPPAGLSMHWSRIIDLPLAALIRAGEFFLRPDAAERLAVTIWPLGLMLLFLAGIATLGFRLSGHTGARIALLFAAVSAPVLQHFRPGAIDHHGAQIVLLVFSLALVVRDPVRPRDAATAGLFCALSMAIGLEMTPAIAALAGLMALRWIVAGAPVRRATASFGAAFGLASALLFAATVAPANYWAAQCDAFSVIHATAAVIGGLGLAALCVLPSATATTRLLGCAALGALLAAFVTRFPSCLSDPMPVDPRLVDLWLSQVSEARSVLSLAVDLPQEVIPLFALPLAGLVLVSVQSVRDANRWPWIICAAVLAVATAIALYQVRGVAIANALASVLVPAALVRIWPANPAVFFGLGRPALVSLLVVSPPALVLLGQATTRAADIVLARQHPQIISGGSGTCELASDYAALNTVPRGLVLGFIDAGPLILMQTPHAVLAAPFHRNTTGNLAMLDVMLARPEDAVSRLASLGVDYVAFCPGAPERYTYAAAAPQGLAAALAQERVPAGLTRIDPGHADLRIYRVVPRAKHPFG